MSTAAAKNPADTNEGQRVGAIRRPNFFIAGAPKCGTSALYRYLQVHPDVFMPKRKEIHYFGSDIVAPAFPVSEDKYVSLFAQARDEKRIGEAAIWYLFSRDAGQQIKAFDDEAKVIVMLRDPREMIYSYHGQRLYNGNENIKSFDEALDAIEDRKQGRRLPRDIHPRHGLDYISLGFYHDQLRRLFDALGRENVHVILFNDFKSDTRGSYLGVLDFLGLERGHEPSFEVVNASKRIRSRLVRGIVFGPPGILLYIVNAILPSKRLRTRLKDFIIRANTKQQRRAPMTPATRSRLTEVYREDVEKLGKLLGRDLIQEWNFH